MTDITFRIVLDTEDDIFRDVKISSNSNFLSLHHTLLRAFGFSGQEMASFYLSNEEWEKGQEISLFDMSQFEGDGMDYSMSSTSVGEIITEKNQKLLYVYDFLKMWVFYLEVMKVEPTSEMIEPEITLSFGEAPNEESKEIPEDGLFVPMEGQVEDDDEEDDFDPFSDFEDGFDDFSDTNDFY